jgi:4-hydroxybenzoate polyprenyltransferase
MALTKWHVAEPAGLRTRPRRSVPLLVLEGMRPRQWVKNAFVLAGVVFAGRVTDPEAVLAAVTAFAAFCLVSGATYLFNDAADVETDRHNPRTATRPLARGDLAPRMALMSAAVAAAAGIGLAALVNWQTLLTVIGYVVLQAAYSAGLKHVLFVDVTMIAAGFVLRALAGALAVDVVPSEWLLLCTALLAMFLGLAKRRSEVVALHGKSSPRRPVLDRYSVSLLDDLIAVVTPATVVAYCVYAMFGAHSVWMLLTVPFVLYGVYRVLRIIRHRGSEVEEPAVFAVRDRPLLACVILWGLTASVVAASTG